MTEAVEHVARAIQDEPSLRAVILTGWRNAVDWDAVARAAIRALMEPTEAMLRAAGYGPRWNVKDWMATHDWPLMIAAALGEEEPKA